MNLGTLEFSILSIIVTVVTLVSCVWIQKKFVNKPKIDQLFNTIPRRKHAIIFILLILIPVMNLLVALCVCVNTMIDLFDYNEFLNKEV